MNRQRILIIGCGLSGTVIARELAERGNQIGAVRELCGVCSADSQPDLLRAFGRFWLLQHGSGIGTGFDCFQEGLTANMLFTGDRLPV